MLPRVRLHRTRRRVRRRKIVRTRLLALSFRALARVRSVLYPALRRPRRLYAIKRKYVTRRRRWLWQ